MTGRPRAEAPTGWLTLHDAAKASGLSRSTVHRRVTAGVARSRSGPSGETLVDARDVGKLKPRARAQTARAAYQVRPTVKRDAAWSKAAGAKPITVWLGELGDAASGFKPKGRP